MKKDDDAVDVERVTVSLEAELVGAARDAAEADDADVSAGRADAARHQLNAQRLRAVIADWETAHGAFAASELRAARARLAG